MSKAIPSQMISSFVIIYQLSYKINGICHHGSSGQTDSMWKVRRKAVESSRKEMGWDNSKDQGTLKFIPFNLFSGNLNHSDS